MEQGSEKLSARQFAVLYESVRTLQEGGAAQAEVRTVLATAKPLLTDWQIGVLTNWYRATFQGVKTAPQDTPGRAEVSRRS